MKNKIVIFIAALGLTILSCKKLEDMNIDNKSAVVVPSSTLFANALRNLVDQETSPSVNKNIFRLVAQYWTETTYPDESNYDVTTRQIPDYEFRTIYRDVLANFKEAARVVDVELDIAVDAAAKKGNKKAVCEILSVYAFQRQVDIFGNVPYSEALDIDNISPGYDDGATIYSGLFTRLDAAIAAIDVASDGFTDGDLVYYGDMSKWKMFAYSLKLKLAINAADVASLSPGAQAAAAVAGGVFASSGDNATFAYLDESPNTNQIYVELVASGRYDFVPANTIVDIMDTLNDPRMPLYFEQNLGVGVYDGGIYGTNNDYTTYSHVTNSIQGPDWRGLLLSYSEVQFYLAEGAARGWAVGGTVDVLYNAAVTTSIVDDWGGDPIDAATYLADTNIALATAPGDTLQGIALQSWLASYDRGMLGWTTYRRLDAPTLNIAFDSNLPVPARFTYPVLEQTLNGANYTSAAAAIGGDLLTTKLFWDIY